MRYRDNQPDWDDICRRGLQDEVQPPRDEWIRDADGMPMTTRDLPPVVFAGNVVACSDGELCRHDCVTDREGSCYRCENCAPRPEYGPTWKFGDNAPRTMKNTDRLLEIEDRRRAWRSNPPSVADGGETPSGAGSEAS